MSHVNHRRGETRRTAYRCNARRRSYNLFVWKRQARRFFKRLHQHRIRTRWREQRHLLVDEEFCNY